MRATTGLSRIQSGGAAAAEASSIVAERMRGDAPDLAVIFSSAAFAGEASEIAVEVRRALNPRVLLGVTGGTVVESIYEIEDEPALAVWAATLPETTITPFTAEFVRTPDGPTFLGRPDIPDDAGVLLFADPFTFPADSFARTVEDATKRVTIVGGLASGAREPGEHRLWCDDRIESSGAVGAVVTGRVKLRALVSQGCRPIGKPATVTRAERNVVYELAGAPPLEMVRELFTSATPQERTLMQRGLHVGRVVDEYKSDFERGDFLIRNVMGIDQDSGAMAVGDMVGVGETIQFHVRDAESAHQDLREAAAGFPPPDAAMLFTCNGRGSHMFGAAGHDPGVLAEAWNPVPLAGFSCSGEIGPVGGKTFLHGFTASAALFYDGD